MKIDIFYLSEANLKDRMFLRDFVVNFGRSKKRGIIIHSHPKKATPEYTSFITKRISAQLSDELVPNYPQSLGTKGLVSYEGNQLILKDKQIENLFKMVYCLVLNQFLTDTDIIEIERVIDCFRGGLGVERLWLFPNNSMSPLGKDLVRVENQGDYEKYAAIYNEEIEVLKTALNCAPAVIGSAKGLIIPH